MSKNQGIFKGYEKIFIHKLVRFSMDEKLLAREIVHETGKQVSSFIGGAILYGLIYGLIMIVITFFLLFMGVSYGWALFIGFLGMIILSAIYEKSRERKQLKGANWEIEKYLHNKYMRKNLPEKKITEFALGKIPIKFEENFKKHLRLKYPKVIFNFDIIEKDRSFPTTERDKILVKTLEEDYEKRYSKKSKPKKKKTPKKKK